jgi:hypothetical protein
MGLARQWITISIFFKKPFHPAPQVEKIKDYSERNIAVAREYMRNLSKARDFMDVVRIQTAFMQSQFNALGEQAKGLSTAYSNTAKDLVKKPFFGKAA